VLLCGVHEGVVCVVRGGVGRVGCLKGLADGGRGWDFVVARRGLEIR
jgi:hypothetical protein